MAATKQQVDSITLGGRKLRMSEYVAKVEETLDANIKNKMDLLGIHLVEELTKNMKSVSGTMADGVRVIGVTETTDGGYRLEIGFDAEYTDFIDKGVRGIKNKRNVLPNKEGVYYQFKTYSMPPEALTSLRGWMMRSNIEIKATNLIKGGDQKLIRTPEQTLAYFIKKNGIEARNFKQKSLDKVLPDFSVELKEIGNNSLILKVSK